MQWDMFSHNHNQWHFGFDGFFDGCFRVMRGHVDACCIGFEDLDGLYLYSDRPVSATQPQ